MPSTSVGFRLGGPLRLPATLLQEVALSCPHTVFWIFDHAVLNPGNPLFEPLALFLLG